MFVVWFGSLCWLVMSIFQLLLHWLRVCLSVTALNCQCEMARFSMRIGSLNIGTMREREAELVDVMYRRRLDICCVQETRWAAGGATLLEIREEKRYKFYWSGCDDRSGGVGIMIAEEWIESVIEVKRVNERIMVLRMTVGDLVLNIISAYAPQSGRPVKEKEEFYEELLYVVSRINEKEKLIIGGDMNGHVGSRSKGFPEVHGGYSYGERNSEGERLLEFAEASELVVSNTWFEKEITKIITYESGEHRTVTDYFLERKKKRMLKDVKVIPSEVCAPQHKLLVGILRLNATVVRKRSRYTPRIKVWRLKDTEVQKKYLRSVFSGAKSRTTGDNVDSRWSGLKSCLIDAAGEACGYSKGPPRHTRTWWWQDELDEVIETKRQCYIKWKKSRKKSDKATYKSANRRAKKDVAKAKESERQRICSNLEEADKKGDLHRMVNQLKGKNKDVVGNGSINDSSGQPATEDEKVKEIWAEYFEKLLNEQFVWDRNNLEPCSPAEGDCELITEQEVREALNKMKKWKAAGPSKVTVEMLKAAGSEGIKWLTELFNSVITERKIPDDWRRSWMTAVYKGKGDALDCGSYRGIKLLEHAMKVMEHILEVRLRRMVDIDEMQFGFRPGRGTTDAIFILRQVQEKFLAKKKDLWLAFVDLEKAFDRVPREVAWWALRQAGVPEGFIQVIRSMYDGAMTSVKHNGGESRFFEVKVGVHQGSVLSPILFIIILEALSKKFRGGLPWELLYADDLALAADTKEQLIAKLRSWKGGLEEKGLRVNISKTKVMRCSADIEPKYDTGKYPCGVCRKGVGCNSIFCSACKRWIHHRCSGVKGKLIDIQNYLCPKCLKRSSDNTSCDIDEPKEVVLEDSVKFQMVDHFCYLGDTIGAGGGANDASRARVRCGWKKFHDLAPVLTLKGASFKLKGKIYKTCVRSAMTYGSETWPMKVEDMNRLVRAERMMMRRMCGVTLRDRVNTDSLYDRLGIDCITKAVTQSRLRWFGHVERKSDSDWTKSCTRLEVEGARGRGRGRKTWRECVDDDLKRYKMKPNDATDKELWRWLVSQIV